MGYILKTDNTCIIIPRCLRVNNTSFECEFCEVGYYVIDGVCCQLGETLVNGSCVSKISTEYCLRYSDETTC